MLETVAKAAAALNEIGIPTEVFEPKGLQRAPNLWFFFFGQLSAPFTQAMVQGREADAHWTGLELTERALTLPTPTAQDVVLNLAARDAMRTHLFRQMGEFPVLLTPVCGGAAFPHRERPFDLLNMMEPVTVFNLLGMPAMVIPFGMTADGLPVGIQLAARAHEEELLLELARRLEEVRGPYPACPI
jgi:Asp-tRNA(Asn)/Glu-tRNA(Gln) amidotransferase A subunit family amidase